MNLQGMLIDRIENRVLVGITIFLASMVLVGWVAINETGRMASFQQQHLARSIEIGAELFASRCAECHGTEGHGTARAPGLNNPQLFGHDFTASFDSEIEAMETAKAQVETLRTAIDTPGDLSEDQVNELQSQLAGLVEEYGEDPIAGIDAEIANINAQKDALIAQMQSAIDLGYDPATPDRLATLDWAGTLDAFILTTLVGGRPVSSGYWPQPMPAWSQTAGGPLRMDQLENLTNYIVNWGANDAWTVDDLLEVQQFAKIPVEGGGTVADDAVAPDVANIQQADVESRRGDITAAVDTVMTEMQSMIGDPNNGQVLYNGALGCAACHSTAVAPTTDGTFTRVNETRLQDPALAGYTAEHYLIESILVPNAYVAPGFVANAMPQDFGERINAQELLDLVAYLESQDGPDPLAQ
jgi:mono/diheme cytochrome c family protein